MPNRSKTVTYSTNPQVDKDVKALLSNFHTFVDDMQKANIPEAMALLAQRDAIIDRDPEAWDTVLKLHDSGAPEAQ